jgi:hypothetical protein
VLGSTLLTPQPDGAVTPGADTAAPTPYRVKLLTRCTLAGVRWRVGAVISVPVDRLRVVEHLCRVNTARPFDERTAKDVELFRLLKRALPPA